MGRIFAYLRTSTDKQDLNNQKVEMLEYARREGLHIDDYIYLSMPIGVNELVFAVWLIVKGFNPPAVAALFAKTELRLDFPHARTDSPGHDAGLPVLQNRATN